MISKTFITSIKYIQESLLVISIGLLMVLPVILAYYPAVLSGHWTTVLFAISLVAVTLVMAIRPLADIFPKAVWLRSLVILRKGFGVLSASIIVSFMLGKLLSGGFDYVRSFATAGYWSMQQFSLIAHIGDLSAIPLLITSNAFSKRIMGKNWKRLQKLAYVYFYSGSLYEYLAFHNVFALIAILIITALLILAVFYKRHRNAHTV